MALAEIIIKNAKPKEKPYSLSNGRGLILDIRSNGSKYHRNGCGNLSKSKIGITLKETVERGYGSCKRRSPSTL